MCFVVAVVVTDREAREYDIRDAMCGRVAADAVLTVRTVGVLDYVLTCLVAAIKF